MESALGEIITFYSYKGGTGRSMALANVACLLAQKHEPGQDILMIDWDLEAPGLHQFFHGRFDNSHNRGDLPPEQLGLIDFFYEFRNRLKRVEFEDKSSEEILSEINIQKYIVKVNNLSLFLMPAGKFDGGLYSTRVNEFDWAECFSSFPSAITQFAQYLRKKFKYVLIDSRTGYTDISGICTSIMPEKLVTMFTPNRQSLSGVVELIRRATDYRKQSDDLRPLMIFPLPSRIENAEITLQKEWRFGDVNQGIEGYQTQLESVLEEIYALNVCDLTEYFDEYQLQYIPRYSYGEELAVLSERSEDRLSLARSFENFAERIISFKNSWEVIKKSLYDSEVEREKQKYIPKKPTIDQKTITTEAKIQPTWFRAFFSISLLTFVGVLIIGTIAIQNLVLAPRNQTSTQIAIASTETAQNIHISASGTPFFPGQPDYIDHYGAPMRYVPAGEFTMGSDLDTALAECKKVRPDCDEARVSNEVPSHNVYLDAYYIDEYEATNAQYRACVEAGVCNPPTSTGSNTRSNYYGNPEFDNYPVIYVTWDMAKTYCEWRGAQLPTEAQWEKAARGTDERTYPWGEGLDPSYANFSPNGENQASGDTTPIGQYEKGKSLYGVYDMAGNVLEWVADWYVDEYYQNSPLLNPLGPSTGLERVLRGGSWFDSDKVRTTNRDSGEPSVSLSGIGLRCARSTEGLTTQTAPPPVQISIEQSFAAPGTNAEGITWDGLDLWLTDNSGAIFRVDTSGNILDSFRSPEVTPQGLTWDGSSFWVYTTNFSFLYQLRVGGESLQTVSSFQSPAEVIGGGITQDMAWDGENLWYANQFKVYKLDRSGNILSSFTFPQNVTGLDWDGSNLWIAYNDFPDNASLNRVSTTGQILQTYVSPILEINGLAWADGSLWALGLDAIGENPMIYELNIAPN